MSKKSVKKSSPRTSRRPKASHLSMWLVVLILAVAFLVWRGAHTPAEAGLAAPAGTTARAQQIDAAELQQEDMLNTAYDNGNATTADSDQSLVSGITKAVPNE